MQSYPDLSQAMQGMLGDLIVPWGSLTLIMMTMVEGNCHPAISRRHSPTEELKNRNMFALKRIQICINTQAWKIHLGMSIKTIGCSNFSSLHYLYSSLDKPILNLDKDPWSMRKYILQRAIWLLCRPWDNDEAMKWHYVIPYSVLG